MLEARSSWFQSLCLYSVPQKNWLLDAVPLGSPSSGRSQFVHMFFRTEHKNLCNNLVGGVT